MGKSGQVSNLKPRVTVVCPVCAEPLMCSFVSRTESQLSWALAPEGERHLKEAHRESDVHQLVVKDYLSLVA